MRIDGVRVRCPPPIYMESFWELCLVRMDEIIHHTSIKKYFQCMERKRGCKTNRSIIFSKEGWCSPSRPRVPWFVDV